MNTEAKADSAGTTHNEPLGQHVAAFQALTGDKPVELALEYLKTAHERLGWALSRCRDDCGNRLVAAEVEAELSGLQLFLIGLAAAANPAVTTPINLKLTPRRGRPKRPDAVRYRKAAQHILDHKEEDGYHSASYGSAALFGTDRTKTQSWASSVEKEPLRLAEFQKRMRFARQVRGTFERGEDAEQQIYAIAIRAVARINAGADAEGELDAAVADSGLSRHEAQAWISAVANEERWRHFNARI